MKVLSDGIGNGKLRHDPALRYIGPLLIFILLTMLQLAVDNPTWFWLFYGIKVVATLTAVVFFFRGRLDEIQGRQDSLAVIIGLVVLTVWLLNHLSGLPQQSPTAFDPTYFKHSWAFSLAISLRLIGACVMAPLLEELVWRSFLMRFLIKQNFLTVPIGTYTFYSFWITALTFALMHPPTQWGVAFYAGIAYGFYLVRTKNLIGCITAHAITNFGICIYALVTKDWSVWG